MTGRKKPEVTESEKEHEYVMAQKRGYGERVAGEGGEFLDEMGPVAEVAQRREAWHRERDKGRPGEHASRSDES
jgi:hypothetical protein